ncbi:MAG: hypothetical protein WBG02_18030 [Candidatus Acidiferrum sp.]
MAIRGVHGQWGTMFRLLPGIFDIVPLPVSWFRWVADVMKFGAA